MPRGCRVLHLKIRRPSALRLSLVLWRPARTTATIISSVVWPGEEKCLATGRVSFLRDRSEVFAEPVRKRTSGFANVRQSACPTSYDIHEVTCRTREPLPYGQRFTGGVDLGGWVGMGTGLASWTTAGKSSISFNLSVGAGLKVAADQGITQAGVAAVRAEYSRVIKQFLRFRVRF